MQNKPRDVRYCGCNRKRIRAAKPELNITNLEHLHEFITERYRIHLEKDVYKSPAPWTDDPVLRNFRFTNVRREHDRETKWLIENIVNKKGLSYEDKLLNIVLFRLFNKHETAELLHMPIPFSTYKSWNPELYRKIFDEEKRTNPKAKFFTGAFNTGGLKRALKWYLPEDDPENSMEMRVMYFMKYLMRNKLVKKLESCENQQEIFECLSSFMGIGEFLGYQMFVDMTYIPEFPFSENHFVVAGPGCKMGLDYLFIDKDGMSYEECLFWLRDNIDYLFQEVIQKHWEPQLLFRDLPSEDRHMNVMSLENCFCELSKYIRAKTGTGRPRKLYRPTKEN